MQAGDPLIGLATQLGGSLGFLPLILGSGDLLGTGPFLRLLRQRTRSRFTRLGLAQLGFNLGARQGKDQLILGQLIALFHQHLVDAARHL